MDRGWTEDRHGRRAAVVSEHFAVAPVGCRRHRAGRLTHISRRTLSRVSLDTYMYEYPSPPSHAARARARGRARRGVPPPPRAGSDRGESPRRPAAAVCCLQLQAGSRRWFSPQAASGRGTSGTGAALLRVSVVPTPQTEHRTAPLSLSLSLLLWPLCHSRGCCWDWCG